jgi:hypothetical protein
LLLLATKLHFRRKTGDGLADLCGLGSDLHVNATAAGAARQRVSMGLNMTVVTCCSIQED